MWREPSSVQSSSLLCEHRAVSALESLWTSTWAAQSSSGKCIARMDLGWGSLESNLLPVRLPSISCCIAVAVQSSKCFLKCISVQKHNPGFVSDLCSSPFNFIMCPFTLLLLEEVSSFQELQYMVMRSAVLSLLACVCYHTVVFSSPFLSITCVYAEF